MSRVIVRLLFQGVRDLAINPLAQVFTLAAVTLVAFLSGLFLMALTTLNYQLGTVRGETAFQVYWQLEAPLAEVQEQWSEVRKLSGFSSAKTYTPEQALQELGKRLGRETGKKESLSLVAGKYPLPATALFYFEPQDLNVERWIRETEQYLNAMPKVERVVVTPLRDELGQAWRKISRYVMWPSVAFLTLVLGLVVGNTIRLSLLARTYEIEILQLVGAYSWYIRLPLLVGGALQGAVGGCLALGILWFIYSQVYDVLNFPPLLMELQFLPWPQCVALVLVPTLMGIAASWLAVRE